jgi:Fungal specific transcription factor domain
MRAQVDSPNKTEPSTVEKKQTNGLRQAPTPQPTSSGTTIPLSTLPATTPESLPILSLFNNAILTSNGSTNGPNDSISREFNTGTLRPATYESSPHYRKARIKRAKICETLTELLPSQAAMCEIFEMGGFWWDLLRSLHFYSFSEDPKMTIQSYVFLALNQDNPAVIGCAISWLAMSLQCLPSHFDTDHLRLPLSLNDLTQQYVSTVEQLIVCDDEIAVSLEGIECIIIQAQFHGNVGRPRKSWTLIRRALSHALLLGLHRSLPQDSTAPLPHFQRRENVWWHLVQCDAYLSLLLGLPNFVVPTFLDTDIENMTAAGCICDEYYRRKLALLVGKISQRNHAIPTSLATALSTTIQIDHELEVLARHLPPLHRTPLMPILHSIKDLRTNHDSVITNFWHYQAKLYLHLPFMLQSPGDSQFDYHRTACLAASREIVQVYVRMRVLGGPQLNPCRIVDFQVFTAAVILILGLLGYRPTLVRQDINQDAEDWNLIYKTMGTLGEVALEPENLVAVQCFQALETLVSISNGQISADENSSGRKIFIPYLGMIHVTPGSSYVTRAAQGAANHLGEATSQATARAQAQNPVIDIDVFSAPFFGNNVQNMNWVPPAADPQEFPLPDAIAMDIDQDWSWMLNPDYQMNLQD